MTIEFGHALAYESATLLTIRRLPMSPRFLAPMCALAAILLAAITFPDGKKLFAGSSGTGAPDERPEK